MATRLSLGAALALSLALGACAGAPPPASCAAAPRGLPAIAGTELVCHVAYASLLDPKIKETRLVTYELTAAHAQGHGSRAGLRFLPDPLAPARDQGDAADYARSGYDLGHMAPAEDFAWDAARERDSFSMANVVPQLPGLNRQGWERLEEIARAAACVDGRVTIFTGPIFASGAATIGKDALPVPAAFFKVVVDDEGRVLAFIAPQEPLAKAAAAASTAVSLADVEAKTGIALPIDDARDPRQAHAPDADSLERYRSGQCVAPVARADDP